jgi:hypothetical protein
MVGLDRSVIILNVYLGQEILTLSEIRLTTLLQ